MSDEGNLTNAVGSEKSAFDKQRLSELTRLVMGDRTVVQFSQDTGLNRGLIGMIINRKLDNPPSQRSIYRMMSSTAKPQNNIPLNEMLAAAGYAPAADEETANVPVVPLQLSDLILTSYAASPSRPLTMLFDLLIQMKLDGQFEIHYHGGWFEIHGTDTGNKYVGISAFRQEDTDLEIAKVLLKAHLLDTLSSDSYVKGLSEKAYYILTNDKDVYDFALTLPRLGAGSMSVLLSDSDLTEFIGGAAIGEESNADAKLVDRILLKITSKI